MSVWDGPQDKVGDYPIVIGVTPWIFLLIDN
jgi:hypothetical protein